MTTPDPSWWLALTVRAAIKDLERNGAPAELSMREALLAETLRGIVSGDINLRVVKHVAAERLDAWVAAVDKVGSPGSMGQLRKEQR